MRKKCVSAGNLALAAIVAAAGLQAGTITGQAAFEAPYYHIDTSGGSFDGEHYVVNGEAVANAFFCDGTDTYYLQHDGTPMTDRLTYHPDGEHIIYFDAEGHEVFNNFAHVTHSIEGNAVDDYCYFDVYGHMYVNVLTYDQSGTRLYYINPYGVMEHNGVFALNTDAANYEAIADGCTYGYANADGTIRGFYRSYEDAVKDVTYEAVTGEWKAISEITYNVSGISTNRKEYQYDEQGRMTEARNYSRAGEEQEYLYSIERYAYGTGENPVRQEVTRYGKNSDGSWCVDTVKTTEYDAEQRVQTETTRQYDFYNSDSTARNKVVSSYQHIYSYVEEKNQTGYVEKIEDHTNYYNGDMETFTHDNTLWEIKTYENGRLVRDEYNSDGTGTTEGTYIRYEYGESEKAYHPETNTTDYEETEDCYQKTRPDAPEFLAYHRVTSFSMVDDNNGTRTVRDYSEAGALTAIIEYCIVNGEEIEQSAQRCSNGIAGAYQRLETEDAVIEKEFHQVYSAQWSTITASPKNMNAYPGRPAPGDTVSLNTANIYTADWTQLVFEDEENPTTWKYLPSTEENWTQTGYTIVTYEYLAIK